MKKRLLAILISASMIVTLFPQSAFADETIGADDTEIIRIEDTEEGSDFVPPAETELEADEALPAAEAEFETDEALPAAEAELEADEALPIADEDFEEALPAEEGEDDGPFTAWPADVDPWIHEDGEVEYPAYKYYTVDPGDSLLLEVESSKSNVTYQWTLYDYEAKEWLPINGATQKTYNIDSVDRFLSFECQVNDSYGHGCMVSFYVYVENNLYVSSVGYEDVIAEEGETVDLKVRAEADDTSQLSYQWSKRIYDADNDNWEDRPVDDEDNDPSTLHVAASGTTTQYRCVVTDQYQNDGAVLYTVASPKPMSFGAWSFEVAGVSEWYSFTPETTGEYTLAMMSDDDSIDLTLYVLDDEEGFHVYDWYSGSNTRISLLLDAGASYYFKFDFDSSSAGTINAAFSDFHAEAVEKEVYTEYGSDASLQVVASGTGADQAIFQWYGYDEEELDWVPIEGETNDSYIVTNVTGFTESCCRVSIFGGTILKEVWFSVGVDNNFSATAAEPQFYVTPDSDVTLQVNASAIDTSGMIYRWYNYNSDEDNWDRIEGAAGNTLKVEKVSSYQKYFCHVEDKYGNNDEIWFEINLDNQFDAWADEYYDEDNEVTRRPGDKNIFIEPGGTATLTAYYSAIKKDKVTFTWYKESDDDYERIEGADSATYTPPAGSGNYRCYVEDGYGSSENLDYYIRVDSGLEVAYAGSKLVVLTGETADLEVSVRANEGTEVTQRWTKYDSETDSYLEIAGQTGTALTVSEAGRYWFKAADQYGNEESVEFVVFVPQDLVLGGSSSVSTTAVLATYGDVAFYRFIPDEDDEYLIYSTSSNRDTYVRLYDSNMIELDADDDNGEGVNFALSANLSAGNVYYYKVEFLNEDIGSIPFTLAVSNQFGARAKTRYLSVVPGGTVEMEVLVSGKDLSGVSYQWYSAKEEYDDEEEEWYTRYMPINGATKAVYSVSGITEKKEYKCEVSDGLGGFDDVYFDVSIENNLTLEADDEPVSTVYGQSATLTANLSAYDPTGVNYFWSSDDEGLLEEGTVNTAGPISLTVPNVTSAGYYYLEVNDKYGNLTRWSFHVIIENHFAVWPEGAVPDKNGEYDTYLEVHPDGETELVVHVEADDYEGMTYSWTTWDYYVTEYGYISSRAVRHPELTGNSITVNQRGSYQCTVTDKYGTEDSVTFYVVYQNNLKVEEGNTAVKAAKGSTVTLAPVVTADDETDMTFSWYQREYDTEEDEWIYKDLKKDSPTLSVEVSGEEEYSFVVKDRFGNFGTKTITVIANENILPISLGTTDVTVDGTAYEVLLAFTPQESTEYVISTSGSRTPRVYVYDSEMNQLASDYYSSPIRIPHDLKAGETYYYGIRFSDPSETGVIPVTLSLGNCLTVYPEGAAVNENTGEYDGFLNIFKPEGGTVTLKVIATAKETDGLQYQWYQYDSTGAMYGYEPIQGETGPTLTVDVSRMSYRCDVTDKYGDSETVFFHLYKAIDINDAVVTGVYDMEYTGARPEHEGVTVMYNGSLLEEGQDKDYTISYNWYGVGTAYLFVSGHGRFAGNKRIPFELTEPGSSSPKISLDQNRFTYSGSQLRPAVTVKAGEKVLTEGTDYDLTLPENSINAGKYTVKAVLKGDYEGTLSASYTIAAKPVTPVVTLSEMNFVYNGENRRPEIVSVKDEDTALTTDDYDVTWPEESKDVNTYALTVTLKGNYSGSDTENYFIDQADQPLAVVPTAISLKAGSSIQMDVTGAEGEVSYASGDVKVATVSENGLVTGAAAGQTEITVSSAETRNYKAAEVKIPVSVKTSEADSVEITIDKNEFTYNGNVQKPAVTSVKVDGTATTEYEIAWSDEQSTNAGRYSLTVTLTGDVAGTATKVYMINAKEITPAVELSADSFVFNRAEQHPALTVKDGSTALTEDDYSVTWPEESINKGSYELTVTLKGNYSGTKTASYSITEKAIDPEITCTPETLVCSGSTLRPSVTVKDGSAVLAESDYDLSWPEESIHPGTYAVVVTPKGNYSGEPKVANYVIIQKTVTPTVTLSATNFTYNGKDQRPEIVSVSVEGKELEKYEYTAEWPEESINAGSYEVIVNVDGGDFKGTRKAVYAISPEAVTPVVTLSATSFTYNGKDQRPTVTSVKINGVSTDQFKLIWSDEKSIDAGDYAVTAVMKGNYMGSADASYTITKAAQNITASADPSTLLAGGTTQVKVTGAAAGAAVTYTSSNANIAAVDASGKVTAKAVGTATITATAAATANYSAKNVPVTIKVVPGATTSVTATVQAKGFKLAWKTVTGATGYKVFRNNTLIKTISGGSTVKYTDTKATGNGVKYIYKIVAFAASGDSTVSKSVTTYFVAKPSGTTAKSMKAKQITLKWKQNKKATGYEIQYSLKSSFKGAKKIAISKNKTVSQVIKKLTSKKKYYVRIRTYKTVNKKKYYSAWVTKAKIAVQ